jgi:cell division protein FtsI (penicillin-binding protein 3)
MDNPKGQYYGASVSAPVFAEVAQQVLEYLGVQHDIEIKPISPAKDDKPVHEDDSDADSGDIQALYQAANDLPNDDPLRAAQAQASPAPAPIVAVTKASAEPNVTPAPNLQAKNPAEPDLQSEPKTVVLTAKKVQVPTLTGLPLRRVIEQAGAAGFDVQVTGSGTSRDQMPTAGTMVPIGTKIVVRCGR